MILKHGGGTHMSGFSYSPIRICIWICVCNHVFVWRWSIRRGGISRRRDTDVRNFLSFHCPGFTKHRIVWSRSQDSPNTGGTLNPLTWLWPRWQWQWWQLENWWKGGKDPHYQMIWSHKIFKQRCIIWWKPRQAEKNRKHMSGLQVYSSPAHGNNWSSSLGAWGRKIAQNLEGETCKIL